MARYEPPHQDLRCLQIQLFSSLVVKELINTLAMSLTGLLIENTYLRWVALRYKGGEGVVGVGDGKEGRGIYNVLK